ncbi:MAG: hypothetical protein HY707_08745 [Ignavibacteriae bacterium]|nr:hypothetical protein [Ignavibacteriota bacterium]
MGKQKDDHKNIVHYIEANWNRGITLKSVSTKFRRDPSDMERIVREETGMTFHENIELRRKARLEELLRRGERVGIGIAKELGIPGARAFYQWVPRAYGIAFTQLRKQYDTS